MLCWWYVNQEWPWSILYIGAYLLESREEFKYMIHGVHRPNMGEHICFHLLCY